MGTQDLFEYINFFRDKAEQNKLVVFVGAGVSCNVKGMPDWKTLIGNMAKAIDYSRCTSCVHKDDFCEETCRFKNDYSTDELLKIPQYVFNKDKALYNKIVEENISRHDICDAPLSSAIFDINPVHIITTNYDNLLESSKNIFRGQYQVVVTDKDLLNSEKNKYIIKMHGDLNLPESIVLKEQDYLDYSQNHILLELFIKSLLTDHIVLFLGYSLNDYNIKLIISWLNYMRSQNNALDESRKVGYIVLDQEEIDSFQESYFGCNNIGVVNINKMKVISDIPEGLFSERGQRLFSFLKTIADPTLEKGIVAITESVHLMSQYPFISYETIMKLLYIKGYDVTASQLRLFFEDDYTQLVAFLESNIEEADKLKHIFINAGIVSISFEGQYFSIGDISENLLFQDELYNLYIQNKYDEIEEILKEAPGACSPLKKSFYQALVEGRDGVFVNYNIDMLQLNTNEQVAHLHNSAVINYFQTFRPDFSKVRHFIQNIVSSKEKELFKNYLNIYDGNTKKLLKMQNMLEKLKKDVHDNNTIHFGNKSCVEIYEMKPLAITEYFFYYYNHVFYQGFIEPRQILTPYIEAIICSNCDDASEPSCFGNMKFENEKYEVNCIDFDIMTKFISTKTLNSYIKTYNVKILNVNVHEVEFLVDCFKNICHFIATRTQYGFMREHFRTLSNIIVLLNVVPLIDDEKIAIKTSIEQLLENQNIAKVLFSINWPDFRETLQNLSQLCRSLKFNSNIDVVRCIINRKDFWDYANNVDFNSLRCVIDSFLGDKDEDVLYEIKNVIDTANNIREKIVLLRLFYKNITDEVDQKTYQTFLSQSFLQLSTYEIYDFIFSGWLTPTPEVAETFLQKTLSINESRVNGVYSYPDPVETNLECIYLMYINDIINDISILTKLSKNRPHLQFLLDQENFDYSQVDFSDYMWENFARHEKYMRYFIAHKDAIIPPIKRKIAQKNASEAEIKILYGFLLDKDDIWKV